MLADLWVLLPPDCNSPKKRSDSASKTDNSLQHRTRSENPDGRHSELAYRRRLVRQLQLRGSLPLPLAVGSSPTAPAQRSRCIFSILCMPQKAVFGKKLSQGRHARIVMGGPTETTSGFDVSDCVVDKAELIGSEIQFAFDETVISFLWF